MKSFFTLLSFLLVAGVLGTDRDVTVPVNTTSAAIAVGESAVASLPTLSPPDSETVKLLYGESHGISWTDLGVSNRLPPLLARPHLDVHSVDYHDRRKLIFFTGLGAVWRLSMGDAGRDIHGDKIVGEDARAGTLAVDWEQDRLYWTSPATGTVWRSDLEGREESHEVIIQSLGNLTTQNNLGLDPYMRLLFIATDSSYCLRSDLEGRDLVRLDHDLVLTTLAVDIHNRRLYVSGSWAFAPVLQSSLYDGSDVIDYKLQHATDWWIQLMSIDVFSATTDTQLFWAHHGWRDRDTAWKVDVRGGNLNWTKEYTARGTILDPETRIWCVKAYHPSAQTPPMHWGRGEPLPSAPLAALTDGNATHVTSGASSSLLTTQSSLSHTLNCLVLVVITRRIYVSKYLYYFLYSKKTL